MHSHVIETTEFCRTCKDRRTVIIDTMTGEHVCKECGTVLYQSFSKQGNKQSVGAYRRFP